MDGAALKVLIADDDKLNRVMIGKLLQLYGAECTSAADGRETMELFYAGQFDMVMLDNNMPGYTGAECAAMIRKHCGENGIKPPVLVGISADVMSYEHGLFDELLPKPFQMEKVKAVIEIEAKGE